MEAEDTVIKDKAEELITCPNCHADFAILYHNVREAQAEISFKAGEKAQRDKQSVVETEAYFRGRNDVCTVAVSNILEQGRKECQARIGAVIEEMEQLIRKVYGGRCLFVGAEKEYQAFKATHLKGEAG